MPNLGEEEVMLRAWEWTGTGISAEAAISWLSGGAWLSDHLVCAKFEAAGLTPQVVFLEAIYRAGHRTGSTFFDLVKSRELTVDDVTRIVGNRRRSAS